MARFKCYLESLSPHQRKKKQKYVVKLDPLWQNFLDLRVVAYIDDVHVDPRIVHED